MDTGVRRPEEVLHCLPEATFHSLLPTRSTRRGTDEERERRRGERERESERHEFIKKQANLRTSPVSRSSSG